MSNILLSIKPQYVKQILDWTKQFELRRQISKKVIDTIYIYETVPTKKIVAKFKVDLVISWGKEEVWKIVWEYSWVSKDDFMTYFDWKEQANAYKIWDIKKLDIDPYEKFDKFTPPQGYKFVEYDF